MTYLLGIDLGTSSLKCLLIAADGSQWYASEREYPLVTPHENWAEQEPEDWWQMAIEAIREVVAQMDEPATAIKAIGLSGQMHGAVFLGANQRLLRRAIIWADQRSEEQCQQVYNRLGFENLAEIAGSGVFPGFMLASLLWVQQHEPQIWEQIRCVLFPKDYVRLRLTDVLATEVTDASGGLLLDVQKRAWSTELTGALGIPSEMLPPLFESTDVVGQLTPLAAESLGLPAGIPVVAGAADQCTGALGSGLINPGVVLATLGTGGQLVTLLSAPRIDKQLRIHTFCHALPDTWYLLGATLAAGLSFRWLRDNVLEEPQPDGYLRMTTRAAKSPPGAEGLIFLPYLVGERLATDVPLSGGSFVGLTLRHNRAHLIRATMEGILFSLKRILDVFATLDVSYTQVVGTGGGVRNPLWRQMMADIFQCPVAPLAVQEQSALGAVILAGLGTKLYNSPQEACNQLVSYDQLVEPRAQIAEIYQATYESFNDLYRQIRLGSEKSTGVLL
jgi:xylulokinase